MDSVNILKVIYQSLHVILLTLMKTPINLSLSHSLLSNRVIYHLNEYKFLKRISKSESSLFLLIRFKIFYSNIKIFFLNVTYLLLPEATDIINNMNLTYITLY